MVEKWHLHYLVRSLRYSYHLHLITYDMSLRVRVVELQFACGSEIASLQDATANTSYSTGSAKEYAMTTN